MMTFNRYRWMKRFFLSFVQRYQVVVQMLGDTGIANDKWSTRFVINEQTNSILSRLWDKSSRFLLIIFAFAMCNKSGFSTGFTYAYENAHSFILKCLLERIRMRLKRIVSVCVPYFNTHMYIANVQTLNGFEVNIFGSVVRLVNLVVRQNSLPEKCSDDIIYGTTEPHDFLVISFFHLSGVGFCALDYP